jgi:hypothetical protein
VGSLRELPTALRDYGFRTVSVEWQDGRPGIDGEHFVATMGHHTAGTWKRNGRVLLTPSLYIVKHGRPASGGLPALPGPLANGYMGRDLIPRCITRGGANHPGEGGPYAVPGYRIPADSARPYVAGWEFEHNGVDEPWTDEFLDACARCLAATLDVIGHRGPDSHLEHKTWAPGRKFDRSGVSLAQARGQIAIAQATHRTKDDEMPLTKAEIKAVADASAEATVAALMAYKLGSSGPTVAVALQTGIADRVLNGVRVPMDQALRDELGYGSDSYTLAQLARGAEVNARRAVRGLDVLAATRQQ